MWTFGRLFTNFRMIISVLGPIGIPNVNAYSTLDWICSLRATYSIGVSSGRISRIHALVYFMCYSLIL